MSSCQVGASNSSTLEGFRTQSTVYSTLMPSLTKHQTKGSVNESQYKKHTELDSQLYYGQGKAHLQVVFIEPIVFYQAHGHFWLGLDCVYVIQCIWPTLTVTPRHLTMMPLPLMYQVMCCCSQQRSLTMPVAMINTCTATIGNQQPRRHAMNTYKTAYMQLIRGCNTPQTHRSARPV